MKKYITEFIGTFFLVMIICFAYTNAGALAPLAVGVGMVALVYMGGPISKAHYNPAITLAFLLRGHVRGSEAAIYVGAQMAGAFAASLASEGMLGFSLAIGPDPAYQDFHLAKPLLAEALFTFLIAFTILNVAASKLTEGNEYYGIAIGLVVMVAIFVAAPISGGAFNPAVGVSIAVVDGGSMERIWWYIMGPFVGAALGAIAFRLTHPDEI